MWEIPADNNAYRLSVVPFPRARFRRLRALFRPSNNTPITYLYVRAVLFETFYSRKPIDDGDQLLAVTVILVTNNRYFADKLFKNFFEYLRITVQREPVVSPPCPIARAFLRFQRSWDTYF